ncbi:NAD-dependent epimerase/dehydratase family protein [Streptococcus pneumoniae]
MKKILIAGAYSYIGTSLEKWLMQSEEEYEVQTLDMRDPSWRTADFSSFDSIFHVAAIVHQNEKKIDSNLYDTVNRDLPIEVAKKAKEAGVGQFIFLSTMSVYGADEEVITARTVENPQTHYGRSKLEAEHGLRGLEMDSFRVAILRPPMVYGPHATGNYTRLSKFSKILPIFPHIKNQRSMIYIDNLSEFVRQAIDTRLGGLHFPQNEAYVTTSTLVKEIRQAHGKEILLISFFNPVINCLRGIKPIQKLFGNLVYSQDLSQENFHYQVVSFRESVQKSEEYLG